MTEDEEDMVTALRGELRGATEVIEFLKKQLRATARSLSEAEEAIDSLAYPEDLPPCPSCGDRLQPHIADGAVDPTRLFCPLQERAFLKKDLGHDPR